MSLVSDFNLDNNCILKINYSKHWKTYIITLRKCNYHINMLWEWNNGISSSLTSIFFRLGKGEKKREWFVAQRIWKLWSIFDKPNPISPFSLRTTKMMVIFKSVSFLILSIFYLSKNFRINNWLKIECMTFIWNFL